MNMVKLQWFFFWNMVINTGIYSITAIALLIMPGFVYKIHMRIFRFSEESVGISIQKYLATYKLLITFFNFAPWITILILK